MYIFFNRVRVERHLKSQTLKVQALYREAHLVADVKFIGFYLHQQIECANLKWNLNMDNSTTSGQTL